MWPDTRLLDLLGIEVPIIQAPMAGAVSPEMVIQVSEAGALGSLPCAMLTPEQARNDLGVIRQRTSRPINVNFFCHVDAVKVPVIAAGGIADARGIAAAFALGTSGVQIGTAYLFCPEATIRPVHRQALERARENETALTNVFTGRPARGIMNRAMREVGPMSEIAPEFPLAATSLAPLRSKAEAAGSGEFTALWAGQGFPMGTEMSAGAAFGRKCTKRRALELPTFSGCRTPSIRTPTIPPS